MYTYTVVYTVNPELQQGKISWRQTELQWPGFHTAKSNMEPGNQGSQRLMGWRQLQPILQVAYK